MASSVQQAHAPLMKPWQYMCLWNVTNSMTLKASLKDNASYQRWHIRDPISEQSYGWLWLALGSQLWGWIFIQYPIQYHPWWMDGRPAMMDGWPAGYDGWMATIHDGWMEIGKYHKGISYIFDGKTFGNPWNPGILHIIITWFWGEYGLCTETVLNRSAYARGKIRK